MLSDYDEPKKPTKSIPYDFWYGFKGVLEALSEAWKGIISVRYWDWECIGFFAAILAVIGVLAVIASFAWLLMMGCLP
jgi:hypothetical protein